jgi:hypothetical protein
MSKKAPTDNAAYGRVVRGKGGLKLKGGIDKKKKRRKKPKLDADADGKTNVGNDSKTIATVNEREYIDPAKGVTARPETESGNIASARSLIDAEKAAAREREKHFATLSQSDLRVKRREYADEYMKHGVGGGEASARLNAREAAASDHNK